ncbi:MAG TPA: T9SS type A sorting domain-containing protein [Chitinophagaceae bacterium]|nr:T9SS type A sorting domain-containing protein [Chitinophagaceae bacterium]
MRRFLLSFLVLFVMGGVLAQTTVFADNFNTSTGATYTAAAGAIGTSTTWSLSRSGVDWGARIDGGILDMTNDASGSGNVIGWGLGYTPTASFTSPYTTTLGSNPGLVTWIFNMRQIRADPAGFAAGSYGVAFILGGTSTAANNTGNGYAVVLGQAGVTDPVRLAKYTTGLSGTLTNIITSNTAGLTDFGAEYLSIKITYDPSTNTWELFLRNDGAAAFGDPASGSLTSQGTTVDNTYTGVSLDYLGGYWQGSTAAAQTAFFDNVTVIVGAAATNTITTGAVTGSPFILATCAVPGAGTVAFSFTGSFNPGNTFTAQLSDDIGSFASPATLGTLPLSGTDPGGLLIPIVIPPGTPSGSGYLIRVIADMPVVTGSSSSAITITQFGTGGCNSAHADYYRSFQTGNWGSVSTWESSPDNTNWISATLSPTSLANIISIRSGHMVTLTSSASADQLVIESGGVLVNDMAASNTFTIANGGGDDIDIKGTGMYQITSGNGYAGYQTVNGGATVHIELFGIIRIGSGGALAGGNQNSFAITPTTYIWDTGSIFDWNTTSIPGTSGAVFFPDATAFVVPVWRFTAAPGSAMGGGGFLVVNGVLEANTDVIFDGASNKTFRNGILGTGNVTLNAGLGRLIVDGDVVGFGGTGTIIPNSLGLQIGGTLITTLAGLISNKTVTGDIVLYAPATSVLVDLGTFNLTVSGTITGGSSARYIKTSGAGVLKLSAIAPAAFKDFPIGNTSYNPLRITNGSLSAADFNARVETGINNPSIAFPTYGVNRTWYIGASAITANVTVRYQYAAAELGINISPSDLVEILQSDYATWSIIPGNTGISQVGSDPYTVTSLTGLTINSSAMPYAIGKNGGWILPIDCIISTRAQKINNTGIISWTVSSCSDVRNFEVQRSVNGSGFQTIGTVNPAANQIDFNFTDAALAGGRNLYRIKVNGIVGSSKYSNTVVLIHNSNDILISSLVPNPVHDKALLTISAGRSATVDFKIYNATGNLVKQWSSAVAEGNNTIEMNATGLAMGMYTVFAYSKGSTTVSRFIKQ